MGRVGWGGGILRLEKEKRFQASGRDGMFCCSEQLRTPGARPRKPARTGHPLCNAGGEPTVLERAQPSRPPSRRLDHAVLDKRLCHPLWPRSPVTYSKATLSGRLQPANAERLAWSVALPRRSEGRAGASSQSDGAGTQTAPSDRAVRLGRTAAVANALPRVPLSFRSERGWLGTLRACLSSR